jgi:hypothetical protein
VTEEQDLAPMLNKIWNYSTLYTLFTDHTGGVKNLCADLSATWGDTQAEKEYFYREERCFKFTASKTKQLHIVPLSDQAFDLIESIIDLHPYSEYIFVGRDGKTCISDNTSTQL